MKKSIIRKKIYYKKKHTKSNRKHLGGADPIKPTNSTLWRTNPGSVAPVMYVPSPKKTSSEKKKTEISLNSLKKYKTIMFRRRPITQRKTLRKLMINVHERVEGENMLTENAENRLQLLNPDLFDLRYYYNHHNNSITNNNHSRHSHSSA
jgi:hypothetical protein